MILAIGERTFPSGTLFYFGAHWAHLEKGVRPSYLYEYPSYGQTDGRSGISAAESIISAIGERTFPSGTLFHFGAPLSVQPRVHFLGKRVQAQYLHEYSSYRQADGRSGISAARSIIPAIGERTFSSGTLL